MADYIVTSGELTSVANAIRIKGGTNSQLVFPNGFVSAIGNISGGGGSSDFSTAEVTIVNTYSSDFMIQMAITKSEDGMDATLGMLTSWQIDSGMIANVILYKGSAGAMIDGFPLNAPPTIATSGNIQNMEGHSYLITGDCTITLSGGQPV